MCKSQQYNSPYLSHLLNITFQYKSEFQFLSFVPQKLNVRFPWIFEYRDSTILELGIMRTKSIKGPGGSMSQVVGLPNNSYKPITNTTWVRARLCKLQLFYFHSSQQSTRWREYQHSPSLRYLLMEAWMHFNESVRNPVWISCVLKKKSSRCMFISSTPISSGLRSSPTVDSQSLNILMSMSVLSFVSTFFISAVLVCCMLLHLLCLLTCLNDVIDAGQNNQ